MSRTRFWTSMFTLLALLALAGTPAAASAMGQAATIADFQFEPSPITIMAGETVTWTNHDAVAHTVSASGKQFDSGKLQGGKSFSFTFNTPGTYLYTCTLHPYMKGEVIVRGMSSDMPMPTPKPPTTHPSPPVEPTPISSTDVSVHVVKRAHRKTEISVSSAHPGAQVLLQLYSREHFSWLQVAHTAIDASGHAMLMLKASVRRPLRVIVVDAGTGLRLTSRATRS